MVTYGEAFTVQPFTNIVNLVDLTGAQLITALQQQVSGPNEAAPKILQVSKGLTYTLDLTKTGAARVVTDSVKLNGAAIDPAAHLPRRDERASSRAAATASPALGQGTNELVGADDLACFNAYLTANSSAAAPIAPPAANRITIVK